MNISSHPPLPSHTASEDNCDHQPPTFLEFPLVISHSLLRRELLPKHHFAKLSFLSKLSMLN